MHITLKLFATYGRYLPPDSRGHACDLQVKDAATVAEVLAQFDVPSDDAVILVNGRASEPSYALREGDVLAIFPALAGG